MTSEDAAEVIERFLADVGLYRQEWNDFVETPQRDKKVEFLRKRCHELDPLVNRPGEPDGLAIAELKSFVAALRSSTA